MEKIQDHPYNVSLYKEEHAQQNLHLNKQHNLI